jgi:hypothetical protein
MVAVESKVVVTHLFAPERASLIELLSSLAAGHWQAPTVCPGWSVKDVALHLLGDDIDLLSRRRDGAAPADTPSKPVGFQELVASLDRLNQTWVEATCRISPRLLCELLAVTGEATSRYLASLDLFAVEEAVSWIRPEPVPNWLEVARQYTERWGPPPADPRCGWSARVEGPGFHGAGAGDLWACAAARLHRRAGSGGDDGGGRDRRGGGWVLGADPRPARLGAHGRPGGSTGGASGAGRRDGLAAVDQGDHAGRGPGRRLDIG